MADKKILGFYILVFIAACLFVIICPQVPSTDLPEWTYEGVVFKEILSHAELANYFEIASIPIPNSLGIILIGLCHFCFSWIVAQKIAITIYITAYLLTTYYFFRIFTTAKTRWIMLFGPIYLFSNSFFWGNLNYNFGNCFLKPWIAHILMMTQVYC